MTGVSPGLMAAGLVISLAAGSAAAQTTPRAPSTPQPAAAVVLSMDQAVRLALDRNQTLRAQRLTIDQAKADEITAGLRPNVNVSFNAEQVSLPSTAYPFSFSSGTTNATYIMGLGYTFERGGKRDKRLAVARATTGVTAENVRDAERQLRFQTEQAFIDVLLAKSVLELSRQNLQDFTNFVNINQQRVTSGDLSEADFLPISIQKLQFQTDLSAAEVGLAQAKATLRQLVGYDTVGDDFDVQGELSGSAPTITLSDLQAQALQSRPDLAAAQRGVDAATDQATLERGNRARDVDGSMDYTKVGGVNTIGVGMSFDLPIHDRNQGNIARADLGIRQASETAAATRALVLTDVSSAFAAYQSSRQIVQLYESGYLDQAQQSLDITTYAFQRGAASLPDLLDAERTHRDTQLAYRQALATLMTNACQINLVVGKPVIP